MSLSVLSALFMAAAAFLLGAVAAWLLRGRECTMLRSVAAEEHARNDDLSGRLAQAQTNLSDTKQQLSAALSRLESEREAFERERAGIEERMLGQFQRLAQETLGHATASLLELATTKLGAEREALAGSLATRVEEIKGIIAPVQDEFVKFSAAVNTLQTSTAQDLGALKGSLQQVVQLQTSLEKAVQTTNNATGELRTALQNPRVAGNWGEISLDRIIELAGMTEHVDTDRQIEVRASDGSEERPDRIIYLTGGLKIPVDAKTSAVNYIRAAGEPDENERKRLLRQSAADLKSRIAELRGRGYDKIEGYAGMTFLFVPNEAMLSSALAQEPSMIEDALRHQIVICSPLLFLCYLRAFANGWRIQKQQENAEEVARRGKMLYERLQSFFAALGKVGWYLNHTVEKFNACVAKMDKLLVPGRELGKMLALSGDIPTISSVDTRARDVRFGSQEEPIALAPETAPRYGDGPA
jgi:DNA recombination protein RmuC